MTCTLAFFSSGSRAGIGETGPTTAAKATGRFFSALGLVTEHWNTSSTGQSSELNCSRKILQARPSFLQRAQTIPTNVRGLDFHFILQRKQFLSNFKRIAPSTINKIFYPYFLQCLSHRQRTHELIVKISHHIVVAN